MIILQQSQAMVIMYKATSLLSHLNFDTINDLTTLNLVDGLLKFKYGKDHLCSVCEWGKIKKGSHPPKVVLSYHFKLEFLHFDLCEPMRVASINRNQYTIVIVDDYSRFTWAHSALKMIILQQSQAMVIMYKATSLLSHLNFDTINDLTTLNLVDGLLKFKFGKDHLCSVCEWGKIKKASHPPKVVLSYHFKLEFLHLDLCEPMRVASINRNQYTIVIVDDYSRFTWVYILRTKDETPEIIQNFITRVRLNYNAKVHKIRTDNGTELKNATLKAHY
nr:hypothetical protein [Tanacetum cinerariifolium]